jgi:hypothetical protein
VEQVQWLQECSRLTRLDLADNPLALQQGWQQQVGGGTYNGSACMLMQYAHCCGTLPAWAVCNGAAAAFTCHANRLVRHAQVLATLPNLQLLDDLPVNGSTALAAAATSTSDGLAALPLYPLPLPARPTSEAGPCAVEALLPARARQLEPLAQELLPGGGGTSSASSSRLGSAGSCHTRPMSASSFGAGLPLSRSCSALSSARQQSGLLHDGGARRPVSSSQVRRWGFAGMWECMPVMCCLSASVLHECISAPR